MTRADEERPPGLPAGDPPWHDAPRPVPASPAAPARRGRADLQGQRAGLITRALANVVDVLVVILLLVGGWVGVAAARFVVHPARFQLPTISPGTLLLVGLGVQAVYFAVTWAVVAGTYGDRLLGLRVISDRRGRLSWGGSVVRAVLCTIFPIGLFWVLASRENRSVQDLLLRTSVVYDWSAD